MLTVIDRGWLSRRTCTESIYRNHPLCGDKLRRGWLFMRFEEARVGECGGVQKVVLCGSFS